MIVLLSIGTVSAQEKTPGAMNKEQRQRMYTEYLKTEGYTPEVDSDGDVRFKYNGCLYFIQIQENDPEFFRILRPNIWRVESEAERSKVLVAVNASNVETKLVKFFTLQDNVHADIEQLVASPEDFKGFFKRAMFALDHGTNNVFSSKMRE